MRGLIFCFLTVVSTASAQHAEVQSEVTHVTTRTMKFGDWQVRCERVNEEPEDCVMNLKVIAKETGAELVQANFAKRADGTLMTLILPLGIYLTPGVLLDIKDHKKFGFPITFCTREGCFVNEIISDETVNLLRKKEQATLVIAPTNTQTVELPFSINGFLDAYKHL